MTFDVFDEVTVSILNLRSLRFEDWGMEKRLWSLQFGPAADFEPRPRDARPIESKRAGA